jgi:CMP-N,N'-diacetyllegionaminic acid synthase
MRILAIIPVRRGSEGVPNKATKQFLGSSLLERTFDVASRSKCFERLVLSSNDPLAIRKAQRIGLEVPFIRPNELGIATAPMTGVILHCLAHLAEQNYRPDAVCLLQVTSPLRTTAHITEAVSMLDDTCDAVCSVRMVPPTMSPSYVMKMDDRGLLDYFLPEAKNITRRQDVPAVYTREGTVYLVRLGALLATGTLYGTRCRAMIISEEVSLSIDSQADWDEAKRRLKVHRVGKKG